MSDFRQAVDSFATMLGVVFVRLLIVYAVGRTVDFLVPGIVGRVFATFPLTGIAAFLLVLAVGYVASDIQLRRAR